MMTIQPTNDLAAELLRLPFDQYGRYHMIREALDAVRPLVGKRLRILDVGGLSGTVRGEVTLPARMFLPDDDVTVVDRGECDLPGYVRGDGRTLDFADGAFDFVISCDTLEHIPALDRSAFLQELLRIARRGVLLAAPFASPEVVAAEALLVGYIQAEHGVEHAMLKEHRDYGLPDLAATLALLDDLKFRYRVYPSGYIHAWLAMMVAKHTMALGDLEIYEQIDAYYTQFLSPDERREPAYRHLLLIAREVEGDWLAAADAALAPTIRATPPPGAPGWPNLAGWLIQLAALRHDVRRDQARQPTIEALSQIIAAQQQALMARDAQIHDLDQRARWLEEQAGAARRALAAVERGRLLRLLNWAQRRIRS